MTNDASFHGLFQLVHGVKRNRHAQIEQLDLAITPMHVRVLKIVDSKPQCTSMDIAQYLARDKAQVTRLLNTLIDDNIISKELNPEDKRSQLICITDKGREIIGKVYNLDKSMLKTMTAGLSKEDVDTFYRIVNHMSQNLNTHK